MVRPGQYTSDHLAQQVKCLIQAAFSTPLLHWHYIDSQGHLATCPSVNVPIRLSQLQPAWKKMA